MPWRLLRFAISSTPQSNVFTALNLKKSTQDAQLNLL